MTNSMNLCRIVLNISVSDIKLYIVIAEEAYRALHNMFGKDKRNVFYAPIEQ